MRDLLETLRDRARRAFTLVELLVVIAIIGVVVGLLLAAVQKVREVANRTRCINNLHEIALAAHSYEDAYGALPPNYHEDPSRTDGSHNLFYGPLVRLLPYLELKNEYRNFSFLYYDSTFPDPYGVGWPNIAGGMTWADHTWPRNPFNRPPLQSSGFVPPPDPLSCPNPTGSTNLPGQTWGAQGDFRVFACPSQPFDHDQTGQGTAIMMALQGIPTIDMPRGNPFSDVSAEAPECMDSNDQPSGKGCNYFPTSYAPGNYVTGRSDYVAVVGAFVDVSWQSPKLTEQFAAKYHSLFNYAVNASLARVPDGTSNTLLFSEFAGKFRVGQPSQLDGWAVPAWASSGVSAIWGTCPDRNNDTVFPGGQCDYSDNGRGLGGGFALGGWHGGRFHVAFADGSVRALTLDIDKSLLLSLAGYNDGDPVPAGQF